MADRRPVVALYHHLPPGGAERAMFELTRRTADRYRYVLFEIDIGGRDAFAGSARSPLHDIVAERHAVGAHAGGQSRLGRWAVTIPSVVRAERHLLREVGELAPNAIVCHHQRFTQAPELLSIKEIPSVYMLQEPRRRGFEYALSHPDEDRSWRRRLPSTAMALPEAWAKQRDIRLTRAADHILCNSDHSREYVWRAYGRDATVIRLGVDGTQFTPPTSDDREDEVLAVGSLDPTKGHDLAIRAVAHIDAAIRPRLRIVHNRAGSGDADRLRRLAVEVGVELILETAISEADLVDRYQRCRAVVLAARVEPLGLTALEALACGTPVAAVREGGYRETVVDGVNGYLADRNPKALGDALARIVKDELGANPAALRADVLARFNWDAAAERYASIVDQAIAG